MKKRNTVLLLTVSALLLSGGMTACQKDGLPTETVSVPERIVIEEKAFSFDAENAVGITLSDNGCRAEHRNVVIGDSCVTITAGGCYRISGELSDGQIIVSAPKSEDVLLLLDGVSVTCSGSAALYAEQAGNVEILTAEGSVNRLSSVGEFDETGEIHVDAALFSRDDLFLGGSGMLTLTAESGHGIVCRDDLVISGGDYTVNASGHGISGKDSLSVSGGTFSVCSGGDAFHAENKDDAALGALTVTGGEFTVTADGDGFSAQTVLQVSGGRFSVLCGGGYENAPTHTEDFGGRGGRGGTWAAKEQTGDDTDSRKGFKAGSALQILGGDFRINTADDGFHSNGDFTAADGTLAISSGDDAIHADGILSVSGGSITVTESYEGLEGEKILLCGGTVKIRAADDGLNASGGNDGSGFSGSFGGDRFGGDPDASIVISGGYLSVDADGDGLDSNGSLTVTGGEVYVEGPQNDGNGALDVGSSAVVAGGRVLAVGSSGMAVGFDRDSTQGALLVRLGTWQNGGTVELLDADGSVLFSHTVEKGFDSVVLSVPELQKGETYTLKTGSQVQTIEMTDTVYGASGGIGGMGGFGGRQNGGDPGFGKRPDMPDMGNPPDMGEPPEMPDMGEPPEMPDMNGRPDMSDIPQRR